MQKLVTIKFKRNGVVEQYRTQGTSIAQMRIKDLNPGFFKRYLPEFKKIQELARMYELTGEKGQDLREGLLTDNTLIANFFEVEIKEEPLDGRTRQAQELDRYNPVVLLYGLY